MGILSLEDIKSVDDSGRELLEIPEWGGEVYVRGLTGAQRASFEDAVINKKSMKDIRRKIVLECVVDDEGKPLFTAKDGSWITSKSATAIEKIFVKVMDISGLGDDADEDAEGN
jgi:hypothetical protein